VHSKIWNVQIQEFKMRRFKNLKRVQYLNVPRPEEKLSVEIRLLYDVHVRDNDLTLGSRPHPHHSPVLEQLTAYSSSTNLTNQDT